MSEKLINSKKVKKILDQVNAIKTKIADNRDELRDLINELEEIEGDAGDAADSLEYAADALSRLL